MLNYTFNAILKFYLFRLNICLGMSGPRKISLNCSLRAPPLQTRLVLYYNVCITLEFFFNPNNLLYQ